MNKKYELTTETVKYGGRTLHRIKALIDIPAWDVQAGDLGGWVESEENLSHDGNCWVAENAKVYDKAEVYQDSKVCGCAEVHGNANVSGYAQVSGYANILGNAHVYGKAMVYGDAWLCGNAKVHFYACVYDQAAVYDNANVLGSARVFGSSRVYGNAWVYGHACVCDVALVAGNTIVRDGEIRDQSDVLIVGPVGSRNNYTTLNKTSGTVCTGCFKGTIDELEKAVKEKHGDNKYGKDYARVIAMFKDILSTPAEE